MGHARTWNAAKTDGGGALVVVGVGAAAGADTADGLVASHEEQDVALDTLRLKQIVQVQPSASATGADDGAPGLLALAAGLAVAPSVNTN